MVSAPSALSQHVLQIGSGGPCARNDPHRPAPDSDARGGHSLGRRQPKRIAVRPRRHIADVTGQHRGACPMSELEKIKVEAGQNEGAEPMTDEQAKKPKLKLAPVTVGDPAGPATPSSVPSNSGPDTQARF